LLPLLQNQRGHTRGGEIFVKVYRTLYTVTKGGIFSHKMKKKKLKGGWCKILKEAFFPAESNDLKGKGSFWRARQRESRGVNKK
jgi:hypothetical protein